MGLLQKLGDSLSHAFNVFSTPQQGSSSPNWYGGSSSYGVRPDRVRTRFVSSRTIVTSIHNQISNDVADVPIYHVNLDDDGRFEEIRTKSGLNWCLTRQANVDEAGRQFRQHIARVVLEKGYAAIVPVDTTDNPQTTMSYDINTMRVGEVIDWKPKDVLVLLYNEAKDIKEEIWLPKAQVAIVENPFYDVMNEGNSVLSRLTRKLSLLDTIDEQNNSGKLDIIVQLPYVVKTDALRSRAETRRSELEDQLKNSKYGIGYMDGTEKITQLNRPAENNMSLQIDKLTSQLFSQMGLTEKVFEGTADEATMKNYLNRTVEPILTAITEAMEMTFLTRTAISQGQAIRGYRDPFKYVTIKDWAEIADKFSRNEIFTSNEIRGFMGVRPSKDKNADKLQNANMPSPKDAGNQTQQPQPAPVTQLPTQPSDTTQGRKDIIQNGSSNSNAA